MNCKERCKAGSLIGLPEEVRARVQNHPCFSEEAHYHYGRMHLPVAPACNIQCYYCNRLYDCPNESRPGVTSRVIQPEEALRRTIHVASRLPQLSVVGIAGPGDPLANPRRTFETFRLIRGNFPDIKLCLSTNGLALPENVEGLKELGIDHVTITINIVDPGVGRDIYEWVAYRGRKYRGLDASRLILDRQLEGLELLGKSDILIKVNSVMIPGINDKHLVEVSKRVRGLGAFVHNIMPLIPVEGTVYWEMGIKAPKAKEKKGLQDMCEAMGSRMMRHCRQCRADAVGLLGDDLSAASLPMMREPGTEERVAREMEVYWQACGRPDAGRRNLLMAVASKGGGMVNQHFGHAKEFLIYETSREGIRMVDVRSVEHYCGGPESCGENPDVLTAIVAMLRDCQYMLCSRIGPGPRYALEEAGIKCVEVYDRIIEVIDQVSRFGIYQGPAASRVEGNGLKCPTMLKFPEYQPKVRVYRNGDANQVVIADMEGKVLEILYDLLTLQTGDIRSPREIALDYCYQRYDVTKIDL